MPLLSALLLAGFLPLTLRLWFIETITGRWLGTVLGVLIQLALELSDSFLNIPVRRRRLSGNPGSKSPAEWEA